jgi:hypothetical protein
MDSLGIWPAVCEVSAELVAHFNMYISLTAHLYQSFDIGRPDFLKASLRQANFMAIR